MPKAAHYGYTCFCKKTKLYQKCFLQKTILKSLMIDMTERVVLSVTPGVYVLRLINGDDVKTQKIVVE